MKLQSAVKLAKDKDLSHFTIRRLGWEGKIREYRCGRAVRYNPEELLAYMEKEAVTARPRPDDALEGRRS
ncbi:hypothetical protein [Nitrospira sp. Nam74]